jgi:hypothetical protein
VITASRMGRLGMLAVGLGIVAALAATPGTASATTDIDISIDGIDVFNGGGSAHASSGMGDMAIAFGPNSNAFAQGGFGDFASAFSTGSGGASAEAGDDVSGAAGNNFDIASAFGNNSSAEAGNPLGIFPDTTGSSFDFASAFGGGGPGAGSVADAGLNGSGDYASAVGDKVTSVAGVSFNDALPANFDWASVWGNLFTPTSDFSNAFAGSSDTGLSGSNDFAFVLDPFGTIGSDATAGLGGNFDLAGVWGADLAAVSTGADLIFHIAPFF